MKVIKEIIDYFVERGELSEAQIHFLEEGGFLKVPGIARFAEGHHEDEYYYGYGSFYFRDYDLPTDEELLDFWWDEVVAFEDARRRDLTSKERPKGKYTSRSKRQRHMNDRVRQQRRGSSPGNKE